ncbi:MAG: hypothetical protein K6G55_00380 [Selenomonadaceae bacterium]|nr:hypothetical protein [Selenomonadaceae bacterium]
MNTTKPELIVMLTYNDRTVENAAKIFAESKNAKAKFWGFKEDGLPFDEMKKLFGQMKDCGKTTVLEVVAYTENECIEGARKAIDCNCDLLMGTMFFDSVNNLCKKNNLKYMPFVGEIHGRPSVLEGTADKMITEAKEYLSKGVYGIDLLGYRYTGDSTKLNAEFVANINAPICIAGSVNSYERLDEIKNISPWAFTIGGAFFEKIFGDDFAEQINNVCDYISK